MVRAAAASRSERPEASSKRAATRAAPIFKRKDDPITAAINAKADREREGERESMHIYIYI